MAKKAQKYYSQFARDSAYIEQNTSLTFTLLGALSIFV